MQLFAHCVNLYLKSCSADELDGLLSEREQLCIGLYYEARGYIAKITAKNIPTNKRSLGMCSRNDLPVEVHVGMSTHLCAANKHMLMSRSVVGVTPLNTETYMSDAQANYRINY